jgi:hypothetical protein
MPSNVGAGKACMSDGTPFKNDFKGFQVGKAPADALRAP